MFSLVCVILFTRRGAGWVPDQPGDLPSPPHQVRLVGELPHSPEGPKEGPVRKKVTPVRRTMQGGYVRKEAPPLLARVV